MNNYFCLVEDFSVVLKKYLLRQEQSGVDHRV